MPQYPARANVAVTPTNASVPLHVDAGGNLQISTQAAMAERSSFLNISAASVVKASAGVVARFNVNVTSTGVGAIYDTNTLASTVAARQIAVIPATAGMYTLDWPCVTGVTVVPGAGQTLAITLA